MDTHFDYVESIIASQKNKGNGQSMAEKKFLTMWNGARNICYEIDEERKEIHIENLELHVSHPDRKETVKYEHMFIGDDRRDDTDGNGGFNRVTMWHGSAALAYLGGNIYMFLGVRIIIFECEEGDVIVDFASPMGNSLVPNPYAIGQKNIYLPDNEVYYSSEYYHTRDIRDIDPCYFWYNDSYSEEKRNSLEQLRKILKGNPETYDYSIAQEYLETRIALVQPKIKEFQKFKVIANSSDKSSGFEVHQQNPETETTVSTESFRPVWADSLDTGNLDEFVLLARDSYLEVDEEFRYSPLGYAIHKNNTEAIEKLSHFTFDYNDPEENKHVLEKKIDDVKRTPFFQALLKIESLEVFERFCVMLGDRIMTFPVYRGHSMFSCILSCFYEDFNVEIKSMFDKLMITYKLPSVITYLDNPNSSEFDITDVFCELFGSNYCFAMKKSEHIDLFPVKLKISTETIQRFLKVAFGIGVMDAFLRRAKQDDSNFDLNQKFKDEDSTNPENIIGILDQLLHLGDVHCFLLVMCHRDLKLDQHLHVLEDIIKYAATDILEVFFLRFDEIDISKCEDIEQYIKSAKFEYRDDAGFYLRKPNGPKFIAFVEKFKILVAKYRRY